MAEETVVVAAPPFTAADILARRSRLIGLDEPVLAAPTRVGDHLLNPNWPPSDAAPRDAAVLVAVVDHPLGASVVLTRRTDHLSAHAGQIAFPGGKIDPVDRDPAAAALREAEEEIGLDPRLVRPIGYGDPYLTTSGYRIVPVVGIVGAAPHLVANPHEVADVFEVPLSFLMTPANHRTDSREWRGAQRLFYVMPYADRHIWGITAGIIRTLFERIYG